VTGKIVMHCLENKINLMDLSLESFQKFHAEFNEDIFKVLDPRYIVEQRKIIGGTAQSAWHGNLHGQKRC